MVRTLTAFLPLLLIFSIAEAALNQPAHHDLERIQLDLQNFSGSSDFFDDAQRLKVDPYLKVLSLSHRYDDIYQNGQKRFKAIQEIIQSSHKTRFTALELSRFLALQEMIHGMEHGTLSKLSELREKLLSTLASMSNSLNVVSFENHRAAVLFHHRNFSVETGHFFEKIKFIEKKLSLVAQQSCALEERIFSFRKNKIMKASPGDRDRISFRMIHSGLDKGLSEETAFLEKEFQERLQLILDQIKIY